MQIKSQRSPAPRRAISKLVQHFLVSGFAKDFLESVVKYKRSGHWIIFFVVVHPTVMGIGHPLRLWQPSLLAQDLSHQPSLERDINRTSAVSSISSHLIAGQQCGYKATSLHPSGGDPFSLPHFSSSPADLAITSVETPLPSSSSACTCCLRSPMGPLLPAC